MFTVTALPENFIAGATSEEILANALKFSTAIAKNKSKSDTEYLAEAREWLGEGLGKQNYQ